MIALLRPDVNGLNGPFHHFGHFCRASGVVGFVTLKSHSHSFHKLKQRNVIGLPYFVETHKAKDTNYKQAHPDESPEIDRVEMVFVRRFGTYL